MMINFLGRFVPITSTYTICEIWHYAVASAEWRFKE